MSLATTADLVTSAATQHGAVLAFNVIGIEHAQGIAAGAEHAGVPVLMQVSENTVRFHGSLSPLVSACAHVAGQSSIDIAVHLDHLQDPDLIAEAISTAGALGVTSIMVDAAHLPYRDNVARTRLYVRQAHDAGLWAEAELGEIGGKDGAHAPGARTDPAEAAAFSAETEIDGLAVAVGSSHAMTTRDASLDIVLIGELAARVDVPLVLHGSSGVPDDQLGLAISAGIRKINVGTALNIAYTAAVRRVLAAETTTVDPRPHLAAGRDAVAAAVSDLCGLVKPMSAAATSRRDTR
ncbi:MAG: class II fructose-bisphosphate aldolase [Mycobacterium sp.]|nr:class II fructose-bisphosphate aldolase [Mycobacterium sp.]